MSTVSTCVGGILLLISKKYKKKLLRSDKTTSSLATLKMKVQTEENFQKTNMDEIKNLKKFWKKNSWLRVI